MPPITRAPTPTVHAVAGALARVARLSGPTSSFGPGQFWRATLTPDGPGTVCARWDRTGRLADAQAWGPGGSWLVARLGAMAGLDDDPPPIAAVHPAVERALHRHPGLRLGASGDLYHDLLPTILAQRITGGEAARQWRALVRVAGQRAPGPHPRLFLPPAPKALRALRVWDFHRLGIEQARMRPLLAVASVAARLWDWADLNPPACATELAALERVGQWTIGTVLASALGDPDAVAVGDYHLKNQVCTALAGQPRGTDDQMLELLSPYSGQRGRVVALLVADGWRAPAFGPRQRILPMSAW